MIRTTLLPALALAALTLAGCGGATAPGSGAPASSAAAPASSAEAPATSAAPSPSAAAAEVKDPCTVLDADTVKDLTGVAVKKGTTQSVGGSYVCTYLPDDGTKADSAVFSAQEGPLQGSLSQVEDQLKSQFDGKVTSVDVTGADDARYVTGKKSGLNIIDVLALKGDVFYQVLVASPRDAAQHKGAAVKITEALIKA